MKFVDLGLAETLLRSLQAEGYQTATPVQVAAIPPILAGRDVLACAQTGTGKTAAFALPTLQRLGTTAPPAGVRGRKIRVLVLSPTRELARQICESFKTYGRHTSQRSTVVYGGVSQGPQVAALRNGVDILIATPGRLVDLMQQKHIDLTHVQVVILDEADQMLDMGFAPDLNRIMQRVPEQRQTLLFSATMPGEIRKLADTWLTDAAEVRVAPVATTAERIDQSVLFVDEGQKLTLLMHWLRKTDWTRTLVFARTKHRADKIAKSLLKSGIEADAIHANKSQAARQRALARFKSAKPPVLVATDIAARGLDIDAVSHVINFDLPMEPGSYVHRIGRTGRAGASGVAISFCAGPERSQLRAIERLTRKNLAVGEHSVGPLPALPEGVSSTLDTRDHRGPRPNGARKHSSGKPAQGRGRHDGRPGGPKAGGSGKRRGKRTANGAKSRFDAPRSTGQPASGDSTGQGPAAAGQRRRKRHRPARTASAFAGQTGL
ncbi:MAG TPA: DEAD/DEAH box helicase [Pirellulales bacterium]|nr:DEAD/DEAH box helicase [Pirellulales bacterium]